MHLDILLLYLTLDILFSIAVARYLREKFPTSMQSIFFFVLFFNIAVPVLGYLCILWIAYYLKNIKHTNKIKEINIIDLEEFEQSFIKIERVFGEGSMLELMQNDYAPSSLKIKALVSMADNVTKNNINIIKQTLSSSDDEVRLYSFAIIDKLERSLNKKIHTNLKILENATDSGTKADAAIELAHLYWDMIYYELSESSLQEYLLAQIVEYVNIACKVYTFDVHLHALLGRIYMLQHDFEKAATEFTFVHQMKPLENMYNMPYLAEINFNLGAYRITKSIMTYIQDLNSNSTLYPVVQQWKSSPHG